MDLSSMIRPALHRITSTFASTNSGFISRVLSFTGSFNDRTSLLHHQHDAELAIGRPTQTEEAAALPPPPPEAPEAAALAAAAASVTTAAGHPFDIEEGTTTPLATTGTAREGPTATDEVDAESKRVGKSVQTVCLFVASASLVLFVNLTSNKQQTSPGAPAPPAPSTAAGQHAGLLYIADMAFISLGFFSSLGLSMFSIVARPGGEAAAVARVQKWGMVVAVASVVVAFSLRVCMTAVA